jgi:putative toxin-antitoxin system antitoxin component (TIGR02293 family)
MPYCFPLEQNGMTARSRPTARGARIAPVRLRGGSSAATPASESDRPAPRREHLIGRAGQDLAAHLAQARDVVAHGEYPRLPVAVFRPEWGRRFSDEELHAVVIPKRTLARRARAGEALTPEETDRALRLARIAIEADRVFGGGDKASRWLRKPNRALGDQPPLALLETETGTRIVDELLIRIEHGMIG